MKIVKWAVDPGLEGDVYADRPWLYGRVGGSVNVLRVGEKGEGEEDGNGDGGVLEEGGDGEGVKVREEAGMPEGAKERRAWFLKEGGDSWVWEGGRVYRGDFFNGYLDFNGGFLVGRDSFLCLGVCWGRLDWGNREGAG